MYNLPAKLLITELGTINTKVNQSPPCCLLVPPPHPPLDSSLGGSGGGEHKSDRKRKEYINSVPRTFFGAGKEPATLN